MDRDELKELIRTEPTLAATFAQVDAEYEQVAEHFHALGSRRRELRQQLDKIDQVKLALAQLAAAETPAPEPPQGEQGATGEEGAGDAETGPGSGEGETSETGEQEPAV